MVVLKLRYLIKLNLLKAIYIHYTIFIRIEAGTLLVAAAYANTIKWVWPRLQAKQIVALL